MLKPVAILWYKRLCELNDEQNFLKRCSCYTIEQALNDGGRAFSEEEVQNIRDLKLTIYDLR